MTITISMHLITRAHVETYGAGEHHAPFDTVNIYGPTPGHMVSLFLTAGKGQAVADAINAAVRPAVLEAAE